MTKRISVLVLALCLMAGSLSPVYAAKHPGEKMARGFINTWNAQYDFFDRIHETLYYKGPLGFFEGFARGVGAFAVRSAAGAYDIITFIIPFPKKWGPVVEPELNF